MKKQFNFMAGVQRSNLMITFFFILLSVFPSVVNAQQTNNGLGQMDVIIDTRDIINTIKYREEVKRDTNTTRTDLSPMKIDQLAEAMEIIDQGSQIALNKTGIELTLMERERLTEVMMVFFYLNEIFHKLATTVRGEGYGSYFPNSLISNNDEVMTASVWSLYSIVKNAANIAMVSIESYIPYTIPTSSSGIKGINIELRAWNRLFNRIHLAAKGNALIKAEKDTLGTSRKSSLGTLLSNPNKRNEKILRDTLRFYTNYFADIKQFNHYFVPPILFSYFFPVHTHREYALKNMGEVINAFKMWQTNTDVTPLLTLIPPLRQFLDGVTNYIDNEIKSLEDPTFSCSKSRVLNELIKLKYLLPEISLLVAAYEEDPFIKLLHKLYVGLSTSDQIIPVPATTTKSSTNTTSSINLSKSVSRKRT